jgi:hypothetical protein
MDALLQRKELLQQKEDTLTESLRRFDHFLKENDARRKRALRKTRDEREVGGLCLLNFMYCLFRSLARVMYGPTVTIFFF